MPTGMHRVATRKPFSAASVGRWAALALLLLGVALRWAALGEMNTMLHYDEAYNAMDALGVLQHPRLTPFFPGNFGREGGFVYWVLPWVAMLPGNPLALRLAGTTLGILTLAALARLARELLGNRAAVWSVGALSVLYWHVHISHLALRANLYVLLGTLSAAWLLEAHRTGRLRTWALAGMASGLLVYSYFAAYPWLGLAGLCLGLWLLVDARRRRGAALGTGIAIAVMVPMAVYVVANWQSFVSRPGTVGALGWSPFVHNLKLWGDAFFTAGDPNAEFNIPGRPILDPYLGPLVLIGLPALSFAVRRRWQLAWLGAWTALAAAPSLLSNQAPHFLRGAGLTIPIALIAGAGAAAVAQLAARWSRVPALGALPLVAVALSGRQTAVDFHQVWLKDLQTALLMEQPVHRSVTLIEATAADNAHVYFSPFTVQHPVIGYRALDLAPRPVGAFDSHQCLVIPDGEAVYVSLTLHEPGFQERLARWRNVEILGTMNYAGSDVPEATVLAGHPRPGGLPAAFPEVRFADLVRLQVLASLPESAAPGDVVPLVLGVRPDQIPVQPLSVFVHLYGDPLPEDGGQLWAQADSQICATYPVSVWKTDETIVQSFDLALPADLPPGVYVVAVGVYWFPDGDRLPVTVSAGERLAAPADHVMIGEITVH